MTFNARSRVKAALAAAFFGLATTLASAAMPRPCRRRASRRSPAEDAGRSALSTVFP